MISVHKVIEINFDLLYFLRFIFLSFTKVMGSPDKSWGLLRLAYVLSHTDSTDSTDF